MEQIPSFCITLERRDDRWKRFQDQPGYIPHIQRFLGVDGKTLNIQSDPRVATTTKRNIIKKIRRSHEELDSVGGVGCALSHIAVWQHIVDKGYPMAIVFEDDAIIPTDFMLQLKQLFKSSPTLKDSDKWDVLLLGCRSAKNTPIAGERHIEKMGAFFGLYGYMITNRGARELLEHCYPIHCHIDIWMGIHSVVTPSFRIMVATPPIITHKDMKTEIQTSGECKICDVSANFDKTHTLVTREELWLGRAAEIALIGAIGYIIYTKIIYKST
jgi:GR25 family glycosyltransferase involved in LPS biosynthesis